QRRESPHHRQRPRRKQVPLVRSRNSATDSAPKIHSMMLPVPFLRALAIMAVVLGFLSPRLSAQIGGLDSGFAPAAILNGASPGTVRAVYWQTNGQVIIAGEFTSIGGTARGRIAR